jgi:hypothetical protein
MKNRQHKTPITKKEKQNIKARSEENDSKLIALSIPFTSGTLVDSPI